MLVWLGQPHALPVGVYSTEHVGTVDFLATSPEQVAKLSLESHWVVSMLLP